jgi:hypothetical protein
MRVGEPGRRTVPDGPAAARPFKNVLVWALLLAGTVTVLVLTVLKGWDYYSTPLSVRGYRPQHRFLRPSGSVGHVLGFAGLGLITATLLYPIRKRWKPLARAGSPSRWLDVHIFFGLAGPILITYHTSMKFNGLISVAFWSMALVVSSGFVGRYLYVRIPRTLRGAEVARQSVEERAAEIRDELTRSTLPPQVLARIDAFEAAIVPPAGKAPSLTGVFLGDLKARLALGFLLRELERSGVGRELLSEASHLIAERAFLLRRVAYLNQTKKLFGLWHVFHLPLVYLMFFIAAFHVLVAIYFGYSFSVRS